MGLNVFDNFLLCSWEQECFCCSSKLDSFSHTFQVYAGVYIYWTKAIVCLSLWHASDFVTDRELHGCSGNASSVDSSFVHAGNYQGRALPKAVDLGGRVRLR